MAHAEQNSSTGQKTPTSVLAEFCVQQKAEPPRYETVDSESNPNVPIFFISAYAFDFTTVGAGRSKIEAKHAASQNLLDILAQCDLYKRKLSPSPQPSQSTVTLRNNDAVGSLITFCQHHRLPPPVFAEISITGQGHIREFKIGCNVGNRHCFGVALIKKEARQIAAQTMLVSIEQDYDDAVVSSKSSVCSAKSLGAVALQQSSEDLSVCQSADTTCIAKLITVCHENCLMMPKFEMVSSSGQAHQKQFTFECIVEKYQCQGTASKKQLAKQNAAMAMIKLIEERVEANDLVSENGVTHSSVALTVEDLPSVEEVLAEYRRIKSKPTKRANGDLRYRKDFFLKLPQENQMKAKQVLMNDYSNPFQAKHIVHDAMEALNLKYEIKRFGSNRAIFTLDEPNKYDCTIAESYDELFIRVIDYLKTMLNMQKMSGGALSDVTNKN